MITSFNAKGNNVDVIYFHMVFYLVPESTVMQHSVSAERSELHQEIRRQAGATGVAVPVLHAN